MIDSELSPKSKIEYLSRLRIIKKNLIHIHGIPKSIAIINLLKSEEYLGQYGTIIKFIMKYKINDDTKQKAYSAYITYSNELEASIAILCIDCLLIEGKIVRAFFGTTNYCNHFLKNGICPNSDNCMYLHDFNDDKNKNIIIDKNDNTAFSYQEHLNLAKKIITASNLKTKYLLEKNQKMQKSKKNIFPNIDFIFLNEEEKEKYFTSGNIRYIKNTDTNQNDVLLNNFDIPKKNKNKKFNYNSYINFQKKMFLGLNAYISKLKSNYIKNKDKSECLISQNNKKNNLFSLSSIELHNIFRKSINHILVTKPFYMALKNVNIEKLELEYFLKDISKIGIDIYELLDGCLDPISHLL